MLESHIFNIYIHIYHISRISKQNVIHFRIGVLTMIIIILLFVFLVELHITYNIKIIILNKTYLHKN